MIKDIVVCLNGANNNVLTTAAKFAARHKARLRGLYMMVDSVNRYYAYEHLSAELMQKIIADEEARAAKAEDKFTKVTQQMACEAVWQCITEDEEPISSLFYTDLIFSGGVEDNESERFGGFGFINHLLLETGRPLVIIPKDWDDGDFGQKIMLGWNESRESARAMHSTIPLLQAADSVNVLTVSDKNGDEKDGDSKVSQSELAKGIDITTYLTRQGVTAKLYLEKTDEDSPNIGEVLLAHADENNVDLAIVGGYSHSRLREMLFGGITRYLIKFSPIPLLLVH